MSSQPSHTATAAAPASSTITTATMDRTLRTAIQIVLQDDCRSRRVEPRLSRSPILLPKRQPAFRFSARKPFVLQAHGKCSFCAQFSCELLDALCQICRCAVQFSWESDHDGGDAILFGREARDFGDDRLDGIDIQSRMTEHAE